MQDLSIRLVLRAQAEGRSEIRAMREETSELAKALAEVRSAARNGGQVSAGAIRTLGGFDEFQKAFADAQRNLAAPEGGARAGLDEEKAFRARLRMTDAMAKVRLRESDRVTREEARADAQLSKEEERNAQELLRSRMSLWGQQRREAEQTAQAEARAEAEATRQAERSAEELLRFKMRMWEQQRREAERAASDEARVQERADRDAERSARELLQFRMRMTRQRVAEEGQQQSEANARYEEMQRRHGWPVGGAGGHGGGHGGHRGFLGELGVAAQYTLVYGAINRALAGVGAVMHSPIDIGQMTLGVSQHAREIEELGRATRMTTNQVQELQYAFAAKGIDADKLPQTLLWLARSEVGAARGIKQQTVAFQALGVSVKDAQGHLKPLQQLLYETTDALHHQSNAAKADAISQMLFGRGVRDILPIVQGGSKALRDMAQDADKSGFVISPEDLDRGEQLAAQWSRLQLQFAGVRNSLAVAAMPVVSDVLGQASRYLTTHRSEVTKTISEDFAMLKADLPDIVQGMKEMADFALAASKNIGPFIHWMTQTGDDISGGANKVGGWYKSFGRWFEHVDGYDQRVHNDWWTQPQDPMKSWPMAPGPIAPGVAGLGGPGAQGPRVDVHVHAAPGVGVGATQASPGTTLNVHRGITGPGM